MEIIEELNEKQKEAVLATERAMFSNSRSRFSEKQRY